LCLFRELSNPVLKHKKPFEDQWRQRGTSHKVAPLLISALKPVIAHLTSLDVQIIPTLQVNIVSNCITLVLLVYVLNINFYFVQVRIKGHEDRTPIHTDYYYYLTNEQTYVKENNKNVRTNICDQCSLVITDKLFYTCCSCHLQYHSHCVTKPMKKMFSGDQSLFRCKVCVNADVNEYTAWVPLVNICYYLFYMRRNRHQFISFLCDICLCRHRLQIIIHD
jgi:hypothetical protein